MQQYLAGTQTCDLTITNPMSYSMNHHHATHKEHINQIKNNAKCQGREQHQPDLRLSHSCTTHYAQALWLWYLNPFKPILCAAQHPYSTTYWKWLAVVSRKSMKPVLMSFLLSSLDCWGRPTFRCRWVLKVSMYRWSFDTFGHCDSFCTIVTTHFMHS